MAEYVYPSSDFDRSEKLLALLGSFWYNTYQGDPLVRQTAVARAQLDAQTHRTMLELVASMSRFEIPVFHEENWYFFAFLESQVNGDDVATPVYDGTHSYNSDIRYDAATTRPYYSVLLPAGLTDFKLAMNRISDPSLTLTQRVDFWIENGAVTFRDNPFDNELVPIQEVFENNTVVDRQAGLWLYRGQWDWENVYEQFGYALKIKLASSEGYKELINAILDAIIQGSKARDLQFAWSAILNVPLIREPVETVEAIREDARSLLIITDKHVYRFHLDSTPLVDVGDVLEAGSPLTDTLQFFELNEGEVPDDLDALVLGPGVLATGYYGELVFKNEDVALLSEEDAEGRIKVSWELSGFPLDVEKFFDDIHERGIAQGKTLAQYLDRRPAASGEPPAGALPTVINPLHFVVENFLRHHTFIVKVRSGLTGDNALGLHAACHLSKIVPPQTLMLVIVELDYSDEPITMNGSGDEDSPGYTEALGGFPCMVAADSMNGSTLLSERLRLYQIRGKCE